MPKKPKISIAESDLVALDDKDLLALSNRLYFEMQRRQEAEARRALADRYAQNARIAAAAQSLLDLFRPAHTCDESDHAQYHDDNECARCQLLVALDVADVDADFAFELRVVHSPIHVPTPGHPLDTGGRPR